MANKPYFMENKDWYYHDKKEWKYKLTEKAPPEAVKSYEDYYAEFEKMIEYPDLTLLSPSENRK